MGLLDFLSSKDRGARDRKAAELYAAAVAQARQPALYTEFGAPDTLDGRFEAVALIVSLVLHRIEGDDPRAAVHLTELFVDDMDAQVRQIGFGDMVVGKQIGRMVGALGGRLGAYRAADGSEELKAALVRNLWRGKEAPAAGLAHVIAEVAKLRAGLAAIPVETLVVADRLPG